MMTMGEKMGEREIDEIVNDSELITNDFILIEDFAKMIMNRIWYKYLLVYHIWPPYYIL